MESLDTARFSGRTYERRLSSLLAEKYSGRRIDLVVALSESAVQFVLRERAVFPDAALLLGMVERRSLPAAMVPPGAGVVYLQLGAAESLQLAFQAVPSAHRALVVGGTSRSDRGWMRLVREDLSAFDGRVAIEYDTDSSLDALVRRTRALPSDTVLLYVSIARDGKGRPPGRAMRSKP